MKLLKGQQGVSIVAAIFIILVLGFMGVMFLSLVNTGSLSSVDDIQAAQALSIAEGGVEYDQFSLAQNLDWYRNTADPMVVTTLPLGDGSFTVFTILPATRVRAQVPFASTNPIRVYSTDRFLSTGCVQIAEEFIRYTALGTTPAACSGSPPCFAGTITRAAAACYGGGLQEAHARGDAVYPATGLVTALLNNCNPLASITIVRNDKLLSAGTLDIQGEEISYLSSSISGVNLILSGVQRCLNGTPSAAHAAGAPVTPVQTVSEAAIESSGTMANANRTIIKTVQR